jgi:hypothetical protein
MSPLHLVSSASEGLGAKMRWVRLNLRLLDLYWPLQELRLQLVVDYPMHLHRREY